MRRRTAIDQDKHAFWKKTLQQWRSSGLGARAFCRQQRLKESQFWWWKRRLAEQLEASATKQTPAFVPVTLVQPTKADDAAIEIRLRSGHVLKLAGSCDRRLLADVVAVLEERPC